MTTTLPKLALDFTSAVLDPRITFTRFGKGAFFSGLASAATTVYVTPGSGV